MTRLSKSHFELIAGVLRGAAKEAVGSKILAAWMAILSEDFADALEGTNPSFDRARFLAACQPSEER